MNNSNNDKQPLDPTDYDGIRQPDVTTGNRKKKRRSYEASTTTPIIDPMGFLLGCVKKGGDRKKLPPPTIFKVPRILRDLSESSFNPELVSIGPIHREDLKLKEFEWIKECYLHDLLHRCDSTPEETLKSCLAMVNILIPQIRECYAGVKKNYSDSELAGMMVMDGCFILEFFFKQEDEDSDLPNRMQNKRIGMDLMLLENQVPLFVLQALLDCTMGKDPFITLSEVIDLCFACYIKIFRSRTLHLPETKIHFDSDSTHDHLLGYLHKRYQLVVAKPSYPIHADESKRVAAKSSNPIHALKSKLVAAKSSNPKHTLILKLQYKKGIKNTYTAIHSIVELDRSGMNFKSNHQEGSCSLTIIFQSSLFSYLPWFKPTLLMPTLVIHDDTELILRNFIAYEHSFPQDRYYFTSYAHAMDMLIDTQEDIAKLVDSKVLYNQLGSNQEAADMINKICKNIIVTEFYYTEMFDEIDKYYNGYWPKNIARLRRTYFNNPWSAIALVAAIILFTLTVVQTVYTIRAA